MSVCDTQFKNDGDLERMKLKTNMMRLFLQKILIRCRG